MAEAEVRLTARLRDDGAARGKARVALDRWRLRGATAALNAWAHYARGRLHRRLGKAAALDHAYGRCAARALHGWKAVTWHEQLRRAARSAMYGGGVAGSERRVFGAATPAPAAATARVLGDRRGGARRRPPPQRRDRDAESNQVSSNSGAVQ